MEYFSNTKTGSSSVWIASFITFLIFPVMTSASAGKSVGSPGFEYDCGGKEDGFYPHPRSCAHFVACVAQEYAYEMVCPANNDGNPLHFLPVDVGRGKSYSNWGRCDYPEAARCHIPAEIPQNPVHHPGSRVLIIPQSRKKQ